MKLLTVILFIAFASVSSFLIKVPTAPNASIRTTDGWVHLQKLILPLFENVCEESADPTIIRLAQEFALNKSSGVYTKLDVTKNLQDYLSSTGLMKKGEIFSEYNADHLKELKVIFEVLYYSKDFTTFYKAASWARQNVNCGLFVDVIYLTILHRRDTANLSLPPPYELLPNYFIRKPFIYKASALFSGNELPLDDTTRGDGNSYIIDANYTSDYLYDADESVLAYFREDIGLNSYYFLQKLKKCSWLEDNSDSDNRHGEYLYHVMRQLAARYSLEKYSHGLPDMDVSWNSFVVPPYDPMLTYSNGEDFGHRTSALNLANDADLQLLESIEDNIATVVKHLRDTGYNKTQIINHLMEILLTGDRNFLIASQNLVNKYTTESQPSVLDHYITAIRDPVFWKINRLVVRIVDNALKALPSYTNSELYFPGLELVGIDVKKISTYFDNFQIDVTDALKSTETNTFQVKIGLPRLNHKAFTVKLNITSLIAQKGLVKIYLGPKTPPGDLVAYKHMFVMLDSFEWSFKKGINVISRSSAVMNNLSDDFASLKSLRKNVADAEFGLDALPLTGIEPMLGFPSRLAIPKGTEEGLPVQIFVIVAPFVKVTPNNNMLIASLLEYNSEVLSPNYPFDLDISDAQLFGLPNALVKEVMITHKAEKTTNYEGNDYTSKWQQNSLGSTKGQDFSGKKKEPYDYKSKKGQYGKKKDVDYSAKKSDYSKYKNPEFRTTTDSTDSEKVVTYNKEINYDKTAQKVDFDKDVNVNSGGKVIHFDADSKTIFDDHESGEKRIGKVDLNKDIIYDINDFNKDVENIMQKYTKPEINEMKVIGDITKDVHVDKDKKTVDFDKEINIPTYNYNKDVTIDSNAIDVNSNDINKEVTVHVDTDYNKVDIDRIYPTHKEIKEIKLNSQIKDVDTDKYIGDTTLELEAINDDDDQVPPIDPTTPKHRKPSIYDFLVHPTYYDDYIDERVFE